MNRIFDRIAYEQLPTSANVGAVYKAATANRRRTIFSVSAVLVSFVGLIVLLSFLLGPYWHPLDAYQILNQDPIIAPSSLSLSTEYERAVVTTLYTNNYATAVAVLGASIRRQKVSAQLILLYLESSVSEEALCIAKTAGWRPVPVKRIPPPHNGAGITPRFKDQYTKLRIWSLDKEGFKSVIYLDADTLAINNFDEVFSIPFNVGVVPDVWEDKRGFTTMFNAGVLIIKPNSTILDHMRGVLEEAKYNAADAEQSFLNLYWGAKAVRLPYAYNANLVIKRRSPVLWTELQKSAKILHYTVSKPFKFRNGLEHIPTHEDTLHDLQRGREVEGGAWKYEIDLWADVYTSFYQQHEHDLARCSSK